MFSKKQQISIFLAFKFIFHWNSKKRKMHSLGRLSIILTSTCVFIPILILSITNGFQYFSLEKLQNFYFPYTLKLHQPMNKNVLTDKNIQGFYEDFILLKGNLQESSSMMRVSEPAKINKLLQEKKIKLLIGNLPKKGNIIVGESLAMQMGLNIGDTLNSFLFFPESPLSIRNAPLILSGIISFENATLDRSISFITPETLESEFLVDKNQINQLASNNKASLLGTHITDAQLIELSKMPSVKQMAQQHNLLLLLVLASSFLCFFSLYMNLKTNMTYNLYSISVLKVMGLESQTTVDIFFLQNILLTLLGIVIGCILCFSIIPHIGDITTFFEKIINFLLSALKNHFLTFKDLQPVQFLPADIFYIQSIPIKMRWEDFAFIFLVLVGGVLIMNKIYRYQIVKNSLIKSLKSEQGV